MKGEKLIGRLATGIGIGTTFTQLDWAKDQFRDSMPVWVRLQQTAGIHMDNPNDGPHDCDAKCWKVSINDKIDGAIVFPLVDGYPPVQVEVIAAVAVRDAFGIEDGDTVTLTLKG
jgi:CTP-dependent riboflavin kinase